VLHERVAEKPADIPESQVVAIWRKYLREGRELLTENGETVRVLYPGRFNGGQGADFLDAVIATGRGLLKGDIEVHTRSSGWWQHGHYLDPAYNRVIMHVVYRNDITGNTVLPNGRSVPTITLNEQTKFKTTKGTKNRYLPCRDVIHRLTADNIGEILDAAGDARFLGRLTKFRETSQGLEQTFYEGIMAALGYAKNKHGFLELARHVPLRQLESIVSSEASDDQNLAHIQSRLLGVSGLLPSQRYGSDVIDVYSDDWLVKLERIWRRSGETTALYAGDWHLSGIRPANLPVRRIAAMSHLLVRYRRTGLLTGLTGGLYQSDNAVTYYELEQKLLVDAAGYWKLNLDYHLPARKTAPAFLGKGRVADIIVNVLLPFAAANISKVPAVEIYHSCPRLAVNNLERHMLQQLGLDLRIVGSARRQQGLLHIYKTLCSQGKCSECPLNRQAA
jgi:hypothetical protein